MESANLQAASSYINNVLLARGLLKGGQPIDFADPDNEDGGSPATMARVINLVNDLVLRRDREAEHRESLATTIRSLRAEESQKAVEIEKVRTKNSELSRSLALAEAQSRSLKSNTAKAEATVRGLKEQIQRMKTTLQQVRGQCANDVRKRDLEMQKLKSYLAERQRGRREGLAVTTININPAGDRGSKTRSMMGGDGVHNPGYSLRQETNDFLTQLCQNLSDENDTLIALARHTIHILKDLQGLPEFEDEEESGMASVNSQRQSHGPVASLPSSCEELTEQIEQVLGHLRTLLTNPSFVPLEEVEVRDDEIKRLREGWEKMESRWRQAVTMMDGWHQRIAEGGGSVQAEELRRGMTLDFSIGSATDVSMEQYHDTEHPPIFEDREAEEQAGAENPAPEEKPDEQAHAQRPGRALTERSDNVRPRRSMRKVSFMHASPENNHTKDDTLPVKAHCSDTVTRRASRKKSEAQPSPKPARGAKPRSARLEAEASERKSNDELSVSQKLAAAESEARAVEQESKTRKRTRGTKSKGRQDRRRSTLTHDELGELLGMSTR
ncbi:NIMA interactive protein [Aspergillus campestris IBT 28561]|uniref:NIMA interactive protein n=1 Tax=Aspergillus campestris (strain IBT 28561) TaxID=1392248 RepID=A0A2I1D841_ASPC2|nr:NIMA interactive protein [Aspergillus campestris IBT 28561]PKY06043.1 NIMA interactive protein [Aspergillus campestris IBT 28561]